MLQVNVFEVSVWRFRCPIGKVWMSRACGESAVCDCVTLKFYNARRWTLKGDRLVNCRKTI